MKLAKDELLLIDSLHGLYPALARIFLWMLSLKLYLEPLLQMKGNNGESIRWTDLEINQKNVTRFSFSRIQTTANFRTLALRAR